MNTDKFTTNRSITRLEELGYVERHVDLDDRRAYNIYLREKAEKLNPK
ncbi:MAG: Winged helix DNA-binding domain [Firmicutes bacterium]|nr:Winged helix DNA-binding domain [Bacillota bacterium]